MLDRRGIVAKMSRALFDIAFYDETDDGVTPMRSMTPRASLRSLLFAIVASSTSMNWNFNDEEPAFNTRTLTGRLFYPWLPP